MTRAVVVDRPDSGLRVADVEVDPPGPGEVRVRIAASGICGSDLHVLHGRSNRLQGSSWPIRSRWPSEGG